MIDKNGSKLIWWLLILTTSCVLSMGSYAFVQTSTRLALVEGRTTKNGQKLYAVESHVEDNQESLKRIESKLDRLTTMVREK